MRWGFPWKDQLRRKRVKGLKVEPINVKQIFLNTEDIAAYMKISKSLVYRLVNDHGLPCFKVGALIRFKKEEVDQWLENQKKGDRPESEGVQHETV